MILNKIYQYLENKRFESLLKRLSKAQQKSRKEIKTEFRDDLFNETLEFMLQHQIDLESDILADPSQKFNPLNEIEDLLKKLSSFENEYRLMENKLRVYPLTFFVTVILAQGRKALDLLGEVNTNNKRIAYYEAGKNGKIDNLIELWTKRLEGENENKLSHPQSRREYEVKRMLAVMKKKHPEHINFFLLHLIEQRNDEYFQKELYQGKIKEVVEDILDFFEVGHATPDMIYKSMAMQIFELFKDIAQLSELKEIINRLIYYSFGKDYKNFTDFGKKGNYLKNMVGEFAIFDFDDEKELRKKHRVGKIFIKNIKASNSLMNDPKFDPFTDMMATNPLYYRLSRLRVKYFGFLPKNFPDYLPK